MALVLSLALGERYCWEKEGAMNGGWKLRKSTTAILNQYNIKWANLSSADKENYGTFKRERERLRGWAREMGGILRKDERQGREPSRTGFPVYFWLCTLFSIHLMCYVWKPRIHSKLKKDKNDNVGKTCYILNVNKLEVKHRRLLVLVLSRF